MALETGTETLQTNEGGEAVEAPAADTPAVEAPSGDDDSTALGGVDAPEGEQNGEEGEGNPEAEAPAVPEAYELSAPEGLTLDQDVLAEATPIFKELGLSNENAQALMPVAGKLVARTQEAVMQQMIEAGAQQRKGWLDQAKAAEDIGGGKWDESIHKAAKGLDALGYAEGSDFRKILNETGFGNHPDMIRIAAKLGELVGEDGEFVRSDAGAKVDDDRASRWYGKQETN